jgi:serine O-acetyltransferase
MNSRSAPPTAWWCAVRDDVRCVLSRDPAARNLLEVWTIYPGVQALALHRMAHALWQRGWRYLPRWISFVSRALTQIDIHPGAHIGARLFIDHGAGVVIGETAVIGDDVTLYHGVTLGGTTWRAGKRHPTLGNHVVVGAGAKILGAIVVGDGARVAANSVVIEAVPAGATVVGIPGRVVEPQRRSTHGFDLAHHQIPDPVGKAIACLLERVAQLEQALAATQIRATAQDACGACNDACSTPGFSHASLPTPSLETTPMDSFLQQLKALSSAEDFLQFFGIPFDQSVVNVSRLHILKRFFQYLRQQTALATDDDLAMFTVYREQLVRAYADFVSSTPAQEKVFKVFQDTNGRQHVSLDSLKASLPQRATA